MLRLSHPLVLVLSACFIASAPWGTAEAQRPPRPPKDFLGNGYYAGLVGGWTIPGGEVSGMTDLIEFTSSVPASDVYDQGLAIGLFGGMRTHGWIGEISMDARLSPVTDAGQQAANLVGFFPDRDVGVEYVTFEVFAGRHLTVGPPGVPSLSLFGGLGVGLALMQLSQGLGVEPYNDEGFSLGTKAGLDWRIGASPILLRAAVRYQLLSAGAPLPRDLIIQFGGAYAWR